MGTVLFGFSRLIQLIISLVVFIISALIQILKATGLWIFFTFFVGINLIAHQALKTEPWYMNNPKLYLGYLAIIAVISIIPWIILLIIRAKKTIKDDTDDSQR